MSTKHHSISFQIIGQRAEVPANTQGWSAYLNRDDWDDWGKYCTQFYLSVVDEEGKQHNIGQVKIGQRKLKPHKASAELPSGHRAYSSVTDHPVRQHAHQDRLT